MDKLNLGYIEKIEELVGGVAHRVFCVKTTNETLMIKQLSPKMLSKSHELEYHINSQEIARTIANTGINSVLAIKDKNENAVFLINCNYYMVYKWLKFSNTNSVTENQCYQIGTLLAKIHNNKKPFVFNGPVRHENYRCLSLKELKYCLTQENTIDYKKIFHLLFIQQKAFCCYSFLRGNLIISHCDLTPHNILWNNNEPLVIDWDAAGYINKEKDIVQTLLSWCIINDTVDSLLVNNFFDGYTSINSFINVKNLKNAYFSVLLENIEWIQTLTERKASVVDGIGELFNGFHHSKTDIETIIRYFNH